MHIHLGARTGPAIVALLGALAIGGPAMAQAQPGRDAGTLFGWCEEYVKTRNQPLCTGYFTSVLQLRRSPDPVLNGGRPVCAPASVPQDELVAIFVAWMQGHPEAKAGSMGDGMASAIGERYPCRQ